MANKIITDLTAVSAVAAADEFEVQKSGETVTKKATTTQITQVEATAREAMDAAIRFWTGINSDGSFPAFANSWYMRNADYVAGVTDRGGATGALGYGIYNGLRILDAALHVLQTSPTFGDDTNYTQFETDGTLTQFGDATTYDDIYPSSVATAGGASAPSFTAYNGNLKASEFVGASTMKEIHIGFQIPHRYTLESDLSPHIHLFIPNDVTGGNIVFGLEYTWTNINQTGAVATQTIYGTVTRAANAGISDNHILEFTDIVGTGMGISSVLMCRLFRDPTVGGDTFASSVWLKSADIHINQDSLGSHEEYIK